MRNWSDKTYWIVGASEGLGAALARQLSRVGAKLVLSSRSEDKLTSLAAELPGPARVLPIDVTDAASVSKAVVEAGEVDGLVYLAGAYWPMHATDWDVEKGVTMVDVNLGGAMRLFGEAVPAMLGRGKGHIVVVGSLSGFRGLSGSIGYGASKAGLMHLAEGMELDLAKTPIEVQLVNPGFVRTRLTDKNDFHMPFLMEPEDAAREIFEHMSSDGFVRNFPLGFSLLFRGSRFFPHWLHARIFGR